MLHYYSFAHEPIRFTLDPRIIVIEVGDRGASEAAHSNTVVHAYDLVPDLADQHVWLGGSLANFAVLKHLKVVDAAPDDRVCISHYRRFLSPFQLGADARSQPGICAISVTDCAVLDPYALAENHPHPFLTSQPWTNGFGEQLSVRGQYERAHHIDDLDRYMTIAHKMGLASRRKIRRFLEGHYLIPGGLEFSMSPVAVYRDVVQKIEDLNRAYLDEHQPVNRSAYQDRFLCYCNERLGSLLLTDALKRAGVDQEKCHGFMHIVSETQTIGPGNWQPQAAP